MIYYNLFHKDNTIGRFDPVFSGKTEQETVEDATAYIEHLQSINIDTTGCYLRQSLPNGKYGEKIILEEL